MLCCLMRVCVCQRRRCSFSRSTVLIVNGVCFLLSEPVRFRCFFFICLIMEGDVAYFFVPFVYLRSLSFSPTVSLCVSFFFFFFYTWLCVYSSVCHVFYYFFFCLGISGNPLSLSPFFYTHIISGIEDSLFALPSLFFSLWLSLPLRIGTHAWMDCAVPSVLVLVLCSFPCVFKCFFFFDSQLLLCCVVARLIMFFHRFSCIF